MKTLNHDKVFFIVLAILVFCAMALRGQVFRHNDVEVIVTTYGIPCEPGDLQFGFFPCPPIEKQGALIHVRAGDWATGLFDAYLVTVVYRTAAGERRTATCGGENPCPARKRSFGQDWDDGWRAVAFQTGRLAVGPLAGVTIESVAVAKVQPATVITVGKTEIGAPR